MKDLEKQLSQLFDNNFDCYADMEFDIDSISDLAMSKEKFIKCVVEFITNKLDNIKQ